MITLNPDNIWQKKGIEIELAKNVAYMACATLEIAGLYWASSSIFIGFDIDQQFMVETI